MNVKPYSEVKERIKKSIQSQEWNDLVQEDVKVSLFWIIDHIENVGLRFSSAFVNSVQYGLLVRSVRQHKVISDPKSELASQVIFGSSMSHELYQVCIVPCKVLLDLPEYVKPNYADIRACFLLCKLIGELDSKNTFSSNPSFGELTLPNKATMKNKSTTPISEEVEKIHWEID